MARSNIWGLTKLGAEVAVCGPRSLLPNAVDALGVTVFDRIEAAVEWAEALNVLRLQLERMQAGYIPSLREYNRVFGVTRERLERAPRDLLYMSFDLSPSLRPHAHTSRRLISPCAPSLPCACLLIFLFALSFGSAP